MPRLGSIAAAPFLGSQFVSLYLGATRVPTVPGKPVVFSATGSVGQSVVEVEYPENDGGSSPTAIRYYVNGLPAGELADPAPGINVAFETTVEVETGDTVSASFVNAIGEGPKSDTVTATS